MLSRSAPVGSILAAVLALASCSSKPVSSTVAANESPPSSPGTSTSVDPLDGTAWRSTYTCDGARKNLEAAGLQKYVRKILGDCAGVQHGYIAFSDGLLRWGPSSQGVAYQIVNGHTFVETYERYSFRIQGDRASFVGHIVDALYPYSPEEMRGEEAVDVATNGFAYERVG
jgi:hypothetical protein